MILTHFKKGMSLSVFPRLRRRSPGSTVPKGANSPISSSCATTITTYRTLSAQRTAPMWNNKWRWGLWSELGWDWVSGRLPDKGLFGYRTRRWSTWWWNLHWTTPCNHASASSRRDCRWRTSRFLIYWTLWWYAWWNLRYFHWGMRWFIWRWYWWRLLETSSRWKMWWTLLGLMLLMVRMRPWLHCCRCRRYFRLRLNSGGGDSWSLWMEGMLDRHSL